MATVIDDTTEATPDGTPAPMFLMLDSIDPTVFRGLAFDALGGYAGGRWPDWIMECDLYPGLASRHRIISYAVTVSEDADFADCEKGDLTPAQVENIWLPRQFGRNVWRPGVYANLSDWQAGLQDALAHYGDKIRRIVARYDGIFEVPAGFDRQQFTDPYQGRN